MIHVTIRREMGRDIDGACGQFRRRHTQEAKNSGELSQEEFLDGVLETVNEVTGEIFRNHPVEKRPQGTI